MYTIQEELSGNSSQLQQLEQQFCNVCSQLESAQQEINKLKDKNKLLEADMIAAESQSSQLRGTSKQVKPNNYLNSVPFTLRVYMHM